MLTATADTSWNLSLHNQILFLARVKSDDAGHLSPSGICGLWSALRCRREKDGRRHWLFLACPLGPGDYRHFCGCFLAASQSHHCTISRSVWNNRWVSGLSTDTVYESRRRSIMKPPGTSQVVAMGLRVGFSVEEEKRLKALFSLSTVFWKASFSFSSRPQLFSWTFWRRVLPRWGPGERSLLSPTFSVRFWLRPEEAKWLFMVHSLALADTELGRCLRSKQWVPTR